MLCATKSGPNWLDRLRSNKGFPAAGDNLDLDHFLKHNPTSSSDPPNPNATSISNRPESSGPTRDAGKGDALLGLMSTAISELFYIDGAEESSRLSGKKVPRKQTHPRVCVNNHRVSSSSGNDDNGLSTVPSLSSKNEELEEERGERELRGYSKSEVTVIDTSCEVWKTEKVVFRRKSVWKVREKKSKVRSFGRNCKRKELSGDEEDDDDDDDDDIEENKKKKKLKKKQREDEVSDQCISLNSIENDTRKEMYKDAADHLNDRGKDFSKDNMSDNRKDSEREVPLKPRKTIKDGSSVVFIKGIPTDEKNEGKLPKKCLKDSQRKFKA